MKKILLLLIFSSSVLFAQNGEKLSMLKLNSKIARIPAGDNKINFTPAPKLVKKNPGLAIALSMLLPGMGELYAGSFESGKYFTIADAVLWGTVIGLNSYGSWKRDNYKAYAQTYAGINPAGKDDNYFANLGSYVSIDDYNRDMDLQRQFGLVYDVSKYNWNWGSDARRIEYRNMWRSSEQAFNSIRFAVGALILNRIISIVNAVRLVTAHNKEVEKQDMIQVSFTPNYLESNPVGMSLNLRAAF